MTPEQLISDLTTKVEKLTQELDQAQQDIKDFELLAVEWKKGYEELRKKHAREIGNLEQVIEQLECDLNEAKEQTP